MTQDNEPTPFAADRLIVENQTGIYGEPPALSRREFLLRHLALLGAVAMPDLALETNRVIVTWHKTPMRGLKAPVRVVQLTDLHRSWCVSEGYLAHIMARTNRLKPDLIALTGDYVTRSSSYAESCAQCLQKLHAPLGVYGVLGNHDYWCDRQQGSEAVIDALEAANVRLITNRNTIFENGLALVGVDDCVTGLPDIDTAFHGVPINAPTLTLTHNPLIYDRLRRRKCLTLAGHTHGGQIRVPLITNAFLGLHYLCGWYHDAQMPGRMYISRGLGVVGIPMRYRSLPEIAVFDLLPA